jgi:large subunit ribosomal protein L29
VKGSEVNSMNDVELVEKLSEARTEFFNLRLRHATGELENTAGLRQAKRDVARLLTVAKARNIDIEREQRSN